MLKFRTAPDNTHTFPTKCALFVRWPVVVRAALCVFAFFKLYLMEVAVSYMLSDCVAPRVYRSRGLSRRIWESARGGEIKPKWLCLNLIFTVVVIARRHVIVSTPHHTNNIYILVYKAIRKWVMDCAVWHLRTRSVPTTCAAHSGRWQPYLSRALTACGLCLETRTIPIIHFVAQLHVRIHIVYSLAGCGYAQFFCAESQTPIRLMASFTCTLYVFIQYN